jgi:hypothetical protein
MRVLFGAGVSSVVWHLLDHPLAQLVAGRGWPWTCYGPRRPRISNGEHSAGSRNYFRSTKSEKASKQDVA